MEVSDVGSVSDWLEDEVCGWLTTWSLSEYSDVFRKNRIRGDVLLHLDDQLLKVRHVPAYLHVVAALPIVVGAGDRHHGGWRSDPPGTCSSTVATTKPTIKCKHIASISFPSRGARSHPAGSFSTATALRGRVCPGGRLPGQLGAGPSPRVLPPTQRPRALPACPLVASSRLLGAGPFGLTVAARPLRPFVVSPARRPQWHARSPEKKCSPLSPWQRGPAAAAGRPWCCACVLPGLGGPRGLPTRCTSVGFPRAFRAWAGGARGGTHRQGPQSAQKVATRAAVVPRCRTMWGGPCS